MSLIFALFTMVEDYGSKNALDGKKVYAIKESSL